MKLRALAIGWLFIGVFGTSCMAQSKSEPARIEVLQPLRHQVFQRRFDVPQRSHSHHPGGPVKGFAEVDCVLTIEHSSKHSIDYRIRGALEGTFDENPWKQAIGLPSSEEASSSREVRIVIPVPAGGWHVVDFHCLQQSDRRSGDSTGDRESHRPARFSTRSGHRSLPQVTMG